MLCKILQNYRTNSIISKQVKQNLEEDYSKLYTIIQKTLQEKNLPQSRMEHKILFYQNYHTFEKVREIYKTPRPALK